MARTPIQDLAAALAAREFPTVTMWNRLEGRPRATEFGRALRAEVRDPLWMLTRQWQFGEFHGEDAATPATVKYLLRTTKPTRYRPRQTPGGDLPGDLPLETVVERRPLPLRIGADPISFDLRLILGRRWLKLLRFHQDAFRERWPIRLPDPKAEPDTPLVAHPDVWALMQTLAGRAMDGYELYAHLKSGGHPWDGLDIHSELERRELEALVPRFVGWFDDLITQPSTDQAYDPSRLEHRFDVTTPDGTTLTAAEYPGGHLDWHDFSYRETARTAAPTGEVIRTVIPSTVRFSGMPLPRLWAIEDGRTNFGAVTPDTTDLLRLLFLEFALVYGNDWYLLPCDLDTGTLARLDGVAVTDVFGRRFWIEPAGVGPGQGWQQWSMFHLSVDGRETTEAGLFLPPSAPGIADGPANEEVLLIRDEAANMVWAIERLIPLASGTARRGDEAARETLAHRRKLSGGSTPPAPPAPSTHLAYEAMNTVPENWIPFIPVHVPESNREIQLRRGAMPRIPYDPATGRIPVRPRTTLLSEGLDNMQSYYIHEEEVPRAGTRLTASYRRTRMPNGHVIVWYGAGRSTGRGEGSSALDWDRLIDQPAS